MSGTQEQLVMSMKCQDILIFQGDPTTPSQNLGVATPRIDAYGRHCLVAQVSVGRLNFKQYGTLPNMLQSQMRILHIETNLQTLTRWCLLRFDLSCFGLALELSNRLRILNTSCLLFLYAFVGRCGSRLSSLLLQHKLLNAALV